MSPFNSKPTLFFISLNLLFSGCQSWFKQDPENTEYEAVKLYNLDYLEDADYQNNKDKLDVFMPGGKGTVPVLLFFHGGGLVEGSKEDQAFAADRFLKERIGVVFANYRLSPEVMHPAHMEDAARAFAWVKQNIIDYGGDPDRIFVSGHSAGGYLAVLMAMDPFYLIAHDLKLSDMAGVIGVSPFLYVEETAQTRSNAIWGTNELIWLAASVGSYVSEGKPPTLLIYADGDDDWRKRHNETLGQELKESGNEKVEVFQISNRNHGSLWSMLNEENDSVSLLMVKMIKSK